MPDSIEQSGCLRVGTVLHHALNDTVNGAVEAEDAMRTSRCPSHNHLLVVDRNACRAKCILQFFRDAVGAFVEQSIFRERQIPGIPMLFALHRIGYHKVDDETSVKLLNTFSAQSLGKHDQIGAVKLGVKACLETDVAFESAVSGGAFRIE